MTDPKLVTLLDLPPEILVHILRSLTTSSFVQLIMTCHQLFDLAAASRNVVLHHLHQVPGIKLGLEDQILSTRALFRILRQRAAASLYGAHFRADCADLRFQNGTLDPTASCLTESTEDIHFSLVIKESHVVRHYSAGGALEDYTPPYRHGDGKPVQVAHWNGNTSVLYERLTSRDALRGKSNDLSRFSPETRRSSTHDESIFDPATDRTYFLVHYKSHDRPDLFYIPPTHGVLPYLRRPVSQDLVPLRLAIHSRLKCAILWGEPIKSDSGASKTYVVNTKSSTSQVVLYTCDRRPASLEESFFNPTLLYPVQCPSRSDAASLTRSTFEKNTEYLSRYRPRSIAFNEGGRNLKLYRAGSITPYAILPSSVTSRREPFRHFARLKNEVHIGLSDFKIESPFFGQHTFDPPRRTEDEQQPRECLNVYLHLASSQPGFPPTYESDTGYADLYIVQNRITTDEDDCEHVTDLHDTGHLPYDELRVVARLWGWHSSLLTNSSLTAVDSVCASPKGTRIAIACWDKILIWPLHPEIFCEEWVSEERRRSIDVDHTSVVSDDSTSTDPLVVPPGIVIGNAHAESAGGHDSGTASTTSSEDNNATNNPESDSQPAMVKATKFYNLVKHPSFGEIVELRPIVLKLPGSAIARKLIWTSANKESFDQRAPELSGDLSGVGDHDDDRLSVLSRACESINAGDGGRGVTGRTAAEDDTSVLVRLTEAECLDQGPGCSSEETRELAASDVKLESLVEGSLRYEPSVLRDVAEVSSPSPREDPNAKREDQDAQTGVDQRPPVEHHTNPSMKDATEKPTTSENVMFSDCGPFIPQTTVQESTTTLALPPDQEEVQQSEAEVNHPQDFDDNENFNLDFTTLDNTDVLHNFDFDSFLKTANEDAFNFDHFLDSHPVASGQLVGAAVRDQSPAHNYLESRPPSPLEIRNRPWRKSEHVRHQLGRREKPKRDSEDELVVLTDRGVQVWNLGVWGKGRRGRRWLDEKLN